MDELPVGRAFSRAAMESRVGISRIAGTTDLECDELVPDLAVFQVQQGHAAF